QHDHPSGDDTESRVLVLDSATSGPLLPDIPSGDLSLDVELTTIAARVGGAFDKLQKRASNVLKLSEENEKLKAELRAMTARLEAAERRKTELRARQMQQHTMEPPSS
ncbi:hypothetical protein FA15DRAFT_581177, partial [Coprinopsis marcescibilis]